MIQVCRFDLEETLGCLSGCLGLLSLLIHVARPADIKQTVCKACVCFLSTLTYMKLLSHRVLCVLVCLTFYETVLLSLGLGDCNIGDDGARHLAVGLQGNDRLQRLVLSGNCISDDGAGYLSGALSQNNTLRSLYLAEVGLNQLLTSKLIILGHESCYHPLLPNYTGTGPLSINEHL